MNVSYHIMQKKNLNYPLDKSLSRNIDLFYFKEVERVK